MPDGVGAGEIIAFETHDGALMEVAVPDGLGPGEIFTVELAGPPDPCVLHEAPMPEWADNDQENIAPPLPRDRAVETSSTKEGRELVLALVMHAQKCLQEEMAPFLEAHCHLFDQDVDELRSGAGETHEQYGAFMNFVNELDAHFEGFVAARGFTSASECFAAIDAAVVADVAEQKRELAQLEKSLRALQRRVMSSGHDDDPPGAGGSVDGWSDSSDDENETHGLMSMMPLLSLDGGGDAGEDGGEGEGGSSSGRGPLVPLMMFSQPMALEELIEQVHASLLLPTPMPLAHAHAARPRPCRLPRHMCTLRAGPHTHTLRDFLVDYAIEGEAGSDASEVAQRL